MNINTTEYFFVLVYDLLLFGFDFEKLGCFSYDFPDLPAKY